MYEKKVGRAYRRGCLLSCGVQLIGLVLGVALVGTVLLLIDGGRVEPRSPRFTLALLMPLLLSAATIGIGAAWVALRARRLDRAFEPFGWTGRQSGPVIRSWHGTLDGRQVDVWFYRGPTLEIYMGCWPATRGAIHKGGPLIRAVGEALDKHPPLEPPPFELEDATFYCHDPGWMRRLFQRASAENAARALMADTERTASALLFAPNAVRYMRRFLPIAEIESGNVRGWLAELQSLAAAVDLVGASAAGVEPGRMEEWARTERGKHLNKMLGCMGVVLVVVMGALFVFSLLFAGQP